MTGIGWRWLNIMAFRPDCWTGPQNHWLQPGSLLLSLARAIQSSYCFKTRNILRDTNAETPFERQGVTQFTPTRVSKRVSRQIGIFTHHSPPTLALEKSMTPLDRIEKITIDSGYRNELIFELNQYGVNAQTLFPHMVGLSRHFSWIMASFDYWAEGLTGIKRDSKETPE